MKTSGQIRYFRHCINAAIIGLCAFVSATQSFGASPPAGSVTAWGYNGLGCLGNGTTANSSRSIVAALPQDISIANIAVGQFHNLAISDGGVYFWGDGITLPVKVVFPSEVTTAISGAAGMYHSLVLTDAGLYAWGGNGSGQLGDGTTIDRADPVRVIFPDTVTQVLAVAAGSYHSLAITDDGVYAWGSNGGALGDGTTVNRSFPVKVQFPTSVTQITKICGGGYHSVAITDNGVYAWGNNTFGQLGNGSTIGTFVPVKTLFSGSIAPTTFTDIAAGAWHTLAVGDNKAYAWGYNGNGELGTIAPTSQLTPVNVNFGKKGPASVYAVAAGSMHSLGLTSGGVYAWGNNSSGQLGFSGAGGYTPVKVQSELNAIAIGAGYYHSVALH